MMHARTSTHARASRRAGFTLIEVITAIALTAIVTAIASAAVASASDARATTLRHQLTLDAESRFRVVLTDMLRHAPAADAVNEPLLRITPHEGVTIGDVADGDVTNDDVTGANGDMQLVFLSQGVSQPFGTGRIWRVTVRPGANGIELLAEAIGRGDPLVPLRTTLPHRRRLRVAVLEAAAAGTSQWRNDWPVERSRPALVKLTLEGSPGTMPAAPLVVDLSPLALPAGVTP